MVGDQATLRGEKGKTPEPWVQENNETEKSQVSIITEGAAKTWARLGLQDGRKGDVGAGGSN